MINLAGCNCGRTTPEPFFGSRFETLKLFPKNGARASNASAWLQTRCRAVLSVSYPRFSPVLK
jgi:hypothetical protein